MHELELNNNEDQELDLTNATICDLTGSATNGSPTASLSDCRRASSFSSANDLSSDEPPIVKDLRTSKGFVPTPEKNEPTKPRSSVPMSNITLSEQEIEDALDRCDVQQQVRASIVSLPGEMQFRSSLQLQRKRSWFLSKLSALRKNMKKSEKPKKRSLKFFDIYKYADKYDIILMIIGSIAALSVGGSYTVIFYIYQQVLNIFADGHTAQTNITVNITNPCYELLHQQNTSTRSLELKDVINYYIIVAFVNILLSWIAWSCWIISAERQVRRIRYLLFRNILRQEMGWFDLQKTGALSNRLTIDLNKMKDGMSEKVPDFLALFGRMIGSLLYSFIVGWKLTLVYLSMSPLVILTFNLTLKVIVRCTLKEVETFSSASSIAQEVLQNIRTVTAFHGQEKEEERFANNLLETKKAGIQKGIYVGLCQSISTLISYVIYAVIIWYGPYLSRTDCSNYSPGAVIVVFFSSMTAAGAISSFVPNVQNFAEAAGSGIHVFDIIERKSQIDTTSDQGEKPQNVTGHIEFRNVTFTYPSRLETSVLNKLSLEIPAGKTVALVGPSGCGKSTTVQLIQRFYDPDQGQIFLDGKDLKTLNVQWLRSHIGIVSQEPVLFMGSIEDNIKFGKPDATEDEVIAAAKMANAHEFIMALPDNYKTTNGDKLSGGQKQRVAIARALISNPKILLLDEATSALDNTSERVVLDTLEKAKEGRTTIVIAHRLSTIRNADIIVGIEHGQIVEYGSHDELMGRKGLYYEFVMTQSQMEITKDDDSDSDSEELDESLLIRQSVSSDRRISRMSIFSIGNMDEYGAELDETLSNISRKGKWLHTPFIYEISKYNLPEWRWILLGTIVSLLYGSISPFYGLIFANLYKSLTEPDVSEQERVTRIYAVIAFFVGVGGCIAQFLTNLSFSKSGEGLTMRMRKMAFSAMLRQEIAYFDQETNSTGALISRLSSDASALKGLTGIRIGIFLQGISAVLVGLIVGFVSSWKLTLVIMAFSPVMLLTSKIRIQKAPTTDKIKAKPSFIEQGDQCAIQTIENIRTVVALHQENLFIKRYEQAFNQEYKKQKRFAHLTAIGLGIANSSLCFFHCICFGYGGKLVENGEISLSDMYRSFAVLIMSMMTVGRCLALVPDYSKAKAAALRIIKLHQRKSLIDPTDKSGIVLDNVTGDIEFRDVDFRYPTRATARILKHFSLKCASGQTTALVGPSGGGKSTTIALLQRFYDSQNGKILLDGHDIKVLNLQWLRSLIGIVQQEPVLFDCSIRDNIAYGDNSREITQAEVEKVARMANIHDLIISLPQGYDTLCGAKGSQLSGGQKQRIAIARALVRNPKILLLDEATSALDNKSERVVQQALDEVRSGRTCLTIAHRLSTISNSEKIAVVNRGKLAEEGTHDQLLRLNGIYTKLASAQERTPSSV